MRLDAPEHLLVLDLLVGEADERLERDLVAQHVVAAHVDDLGGDEALDQAEDVRVGAALHLREETSLVGRQKCEPVDSRQAVRQEALREVELATAYHVAVDVPADALGRVDAARVAALSDAAGLDEVCGQVCMNDISLAWCGKGRPAESPAAGRPLQRRAAGVMVSARCNGAIAAAARFVVTL